MGTNGSSLSPSSLASWARRSILLRASRARVTSSARAAPKPLRCALAEATPERGNRSATSTPSAAARIDRLLIVAFRRAFSTRNTVAEAHPAFSASCSCVSPNRCRAARTCWPTWTRTGSALDSDPLWSTDFLRSFREIARPVRLFAVLIRCVLATPRPSQALRAKYAPNKPFRNRG